MSLKIDMLRCFVTVAECGNLADAAIRLNRSQAALSMTLKQLEAHLGKPLFETDRKSKLTALGDFVFEQAMNEVRQFDRTVRTIEHYARTGAGLIRIASVPSVAGIVLPQALKQFIEQFPSVQIELRDMDSASVLRAIRSERADIGIATVPEGTSPLHRTPLLADDFGLVCSQSHRLSKRSGDLRWQALEGETFIANDLCSTIRAPEFGAIYQQTTLRVHNIVSLLAMVKAGVGVTVLPRMVMQLHPDETVFRTIGDVPATRQIDLLHGAGTNSSVAVDALSQLIVAAANDLLWDKVQVL